MQIFQTLIFDKDYKEVTHTTWQKNDAHRRLFALNINKQKSNTWNVPHPIVLSERCSTEQQVLIKFVKNETSLLSYNPVNHNITKNVDNFFHAKAANHWVSMPQKQIGKYKRKHTFFLKKIAAILPVKENQINQVYISHAALNTPQR